MIRVLVTACTSGPLLEAQAAALERHMVGEYELVVVNDAKDEEHFSNMWATGKATEIEQAVERVGARHLRFPQEWHDERWHLFPYQPRETDDVQNANTRCADAVQYGVNVLLGESYEPLLILDADMVPYRAVEAEELLGIKAIWGVPQNRDGIIYLWNGLLLVDPEKARGMELFDLNCAHIGETPCDVGGMLYRFLKANDGGFGSFGIMSARVHTFSNNSNLPDGLRDFFAWDSGEQGKHRISETYGNVFAHLGGGGNWEVRDKDEAEERVRRFIEAVS